MNIAKAPKLKTNIANFFFVFDLDTGSIKTLYSTAAYGADYPPNMGVRVSRLGTSYELHKEFFFDFDYNDMLVNDEELKNFLEDLCDIFGKNYCFGELQEARDFFEELVTSHQKKNILSVIEDGEDKPRRRM